MATIAGGGSGGFNSATGIFSLPIDLGAIHRQAQAAVNQASLYIQYMSDIGDFALDFIPGWGLFECTADRCLNSEGELNTEGWFAVAGLVPIPASELATKAEHVFGINTARHKLEPVLEVFENNSARATEEIWTAGQSLLESGGMKIQPNGVARHTDNVVEVAGHKINVGGVVRGGQFELGTAYIPTF